MLIDKTTGRVPWGPASLGECGVRLSEWGKCSRQLLAVAGCRPAGLRKHALPFQPQRIRADSWGRCSLRPSATVLGKMRLKIISKSIAAITDKKRSGHLENQGRCGSRSPVRAERGRGCGECDVTAEVQQGGKTMFWAHLAREFGGHTRQRAGRPDRCTHTGGCAAACLSASPCTFRSQKHPIVFSSPVCW